MNLYMLKSKTTDFPVFQDGRLFITDILVQAETLAERLGKDIVVFHEEPTEPCEHCQKPPKFYIVEEVAEKCPAIVDDRRSVPANLCPNCGRRLIDETVSDQR